MAVAPLSYGDKLARKFLPQLQGPNQEQQHDEKILTFQRLRRYDIARIQHDLIKLQHTIMANGGNEEDRVKLSSLLQDHASAIKNLDYLSQNLSRWSRSSAFVTDIKRDFPEVTCGNITEVEVAYLKPEGSLLGHNRLNEFLNRHLRPSWTWTDVEKTARSSDYDQYLKDRSKNQPREVSGTVHFIGGTIVAFFTGAVVIGPIAFMSTHPDHSKNLLTILVSVSVLSLFLAGVVQMKAKDLFLIVATYSAVLVVFVGTSGSKFGAGGGGG